jgi:hypothetical protein
MEQLPGMSDQELFEGMTSEALLGQVALDLERMATIRDRIRLASDVLSGAYGIEIDPLLESRDETKITNT